MRIPRWEEWLRRAFVAASVTWAVLLPFTAFAATRPHAPSVVYAGAAAVYVVGSALCHQVAERSFLLWGVQLPVCARCLGIYVGGAIAALATVAIARGRSDRTARRTVRVGLLAASLPTLVTLACESMAGVTPGNGIRALAGLPLGAMVAWLVVRPTRAAAGSSEAADG